MKRFTTFLFALCMVPGLAFAQNWTFENDVPDTSQYEGSRGVHGLAVDAEGQVWMSAYWPDEVSVDVTYSDMNGEDSTVSSAAGALLIYNADGTPADTLVYSEASGDTLGGFINSSGNWEWRSMRGMRYDPVSNHVYAVFNPILYKIDAETHEVVAQVEPGIGSLTAPAFDDQGNVYISSVVGSESTIKMYDSDLNFVQDIGSIAESFSRSFEVDGDGTIYYAGYTTGRVLRWAKPDPFPPYQAVPDTVLRGFASESFAFHPTTGRLWLSAGSPLDLPGESPETGYAYDLQTWYSFNTSDIGTANEIPVDSLKWNLDGGDDSESRPRAMAWTADGLTVYVSTYNAPAPSVQKFTGTPVVVSIEDEFAAAQPNGYELKNNYPNPFNPSTNIEFALEESGLTKLAVYDLLGREVATLVNENMSAGSHTVTFDAAQLSSGTYLYVLQVNGVRLTNKMTLIK